MNDSLSDSVSEKLESGKKAGRSGLQKVIYGRTGVLIILVILQVLFLLRIYQWLDSYSVYYYAASVLISLVLTIYIINRDINPYFKIAWLVPILVAPLLGILCYAFVYTQTGTRRANRRLCKVIEETSPYLRQDKEVMEHLREESPQTANLAYYIKEHGGYPAHGNTEAVYFPLGENQYEVLCEELRKAKEFIFMEYFIIEEGEMWSTILGILREKVKEGVEVRFMYDGMNCLVRMPYEYPKQLIAYGIQCKMFAPIRPVLSTVQNNRDHRKIVVIDGHTAFTGGINLADEYINKKNRFGHWKDTGIMIRGDAVQNFTIMFLQMWNIDASGPESYTYYLRPKSAVRRPELGYVIPYGDSPLDKENVGEMIYLDIINQATDYVHICSPYLILDGEMETALRFAAKRGVDVRLIIPHVPDKEYAYVLAKNHCPNLIRSGVKVYEYTPGFIHAKTFVSDDCKCTVGTVNLDFRSLYLHFECGVFVYQNPVVMDVERDFQETLEKSQRMRLEDYKKYPLRKRILGWMLRAVSPLL